MTTKEQVDLSHYFKTMAPRAVQTLLKQGRVQDIMRLDGGTTFSGNAPWAIVMKDGRPFAVERAE